MCMYICIYMYYSLRDSHQLSRYKSTCLFVSRCPPGPSDGHSTVKTAIRNQVIIRSGWMFSDKPKSLLLVDRVVVFVQSWGSDI